MTPSESVTNCNRLKLPAADGKNYLTDIARRNHAVTSAARPEAKLRGSL